MQILHTGRGVPFKDVRRGAAFRFFHQGKWLIALKVFDPDGDAVVVLTEGGAKLPPFTLFGPDAAGDKGALTTVLELGDVALVPSADERAVTPPTGSYAEPGELELKDGKVLLVITLPGDTRRRVDVETGEVGSWAGSRPIIYAEWSLAQRVMSQQVTIYTHKPPAVGEPA